MKRVVAPKGRVRKVPAGIVGLIQLEGKVSVKTRRFDNDDVRKPDGDDNNSGQASCSATREQGPDIGAIKELSGERGGTREVNSLMHVSLVEFL